MYQDARSTCRAIVIIITPFVFKMSLTCRDNFVFVKDVMTFKTCPLVRIDPVSSKKDLCLRLLDIFHVPCDTNITTHLLLN